VQAAGAERRRRQLSVASRRRTAPAGRREHQHPAGRECTQRGDDLARAAARQVEDARWRRVAGGTLPSLPLPAGGTWRAGRSVGDSTPAAAVPAGRRSSAEATAAVAAAAAPPLPTNAGQWPAWKSRNAASGTSERPCDEARASTSPLPGGGSATTAAPSTPSRPAATPHGDSRRSATGCTATTGRSEGGRRPHGAGAARGVDADPHPRLAVDDGGGGVVADGDTSPCLSAALRAAAAIKSAAWAADGAAPAAWPLVGTPVAACRQPAPRA